MHSKTHTHHSPVLCQYLRRKITCLYLFWDKVDITVINPWCFSKLLRTKTIRRLPATKALQAPPAINPTGILSNKHVSAIYAQSQILQSLEAAGFKLVSRVLPKSIWKEGRAVRITLNTTQTQQYFSTGPREDEHEALC